MVIDILGYASYAVSAHLGAGAVGIIHFHLEICISIVNGIDEDQSVGSDAKVSVGDLYGQLRLFFLRHRLFSPVNINVIITATLHFSKIYVHKASHSLKKLLKLLVYNNLKLL